MSRKLITAVLLLSILSGELKAQDSLKIFFIGEFSGKDAFILKYNNNDLFAVKPPKNYYSKVVTISIDTNKIKHFDNLPLELLAKRKHGNFHSVKLKFIYQKDRKILIIEHFPVEKEKLSFRLLWLDKQRKGLLVPEYDYFIWNEK